MTPLSRREKIKAAAVATAGAVASPTIMLGKAGLLANSRVNNAFVGSGGRAKSKIQALAGENIVALCAVDEGRAAEMRELHPQAKVFKDYRVLLDKMGKEIGAVRSGTQPGSNFDHAARFTEAALLGNVSLYAGERIEYDPAKMRIKNVKSANKNLYSLYDDNKEFLPA